VYINFKLLNQLQNSLCRLFDESGNTFKYYEGLKTDLTVGPQYEILGQCYLLDLTTVNNRHRHIVLDRMGIQLCLQIFLKEIVTLPVHGKSKMKRGPGGSIS
jgi:hypothetical protein